MAEHHHELHYRLHRLANLKAVERRENERLGDHFVRFLRGNNFIAKRTLRNGAKMPEFKYESSEMTFAEAIVQKFLQLHGHNGYDYKLEGSLRGKARFTVVIFNPKWGYAVRS